MLLTILMYWIAVVTPMTAYPITPTESKDPCLPSPCGPNSTCNATNDQAVCTCQSLFIGTPPNCRPECLESSECGQQQVCIKQKCINPCEDMCGQNSDCKVINRSPICTCRPQYTGDPFNRCYRISDANATSPQSNPCQPSPCGPFSQCRDLGGQPSCSCLLEATGSPPNCRPECSINKDCPNEKACTNGTCVDPCPGSCGTNARCRVVNHLSICTCFDGYMGDPMVSCTPKPSNGTIPTTTTETPLESLLESTEEDIES
ncbi:hypothetical protein K1T71_000608 [Dendrolimus kikuchii]|uniref:Uncharacterized protein n=1 Tax=Dendrolimus kikuchii TaxID=765133 RepID=A0ACC1DJV6_9NEOP|nr:hypothetical protein K1T71_000608 [Dendrolimus kikuchii]